MNDSSDIRNIDISVINARNNGCKLITDMINMSFNNEIPVSFQISV